MTELDELNCELIDAGECTPYECALAYDAPAAITYLIEEPMCSICFNLASEGHEPGCEAAYEGAQS